MSYTRTQVGIAGFRPHFSVRC